MEIKHLREQYMRIGKKKLQILYQKKYDVFISQHHIQYVIQKYNLYYDPAKVKTIRSKKMRDKGTKKIRINKINPKNYLSDDKSFFFCCDMIVLYLPYGIKRYVATTIEYEKKIAYAASLQE